MHQALDPMNDEVKVEIGLVARAFTLWMNTYKTDPDGFKNSMQTVRDYEADPQGYGADMAAYLFELMEKVAGLTATPIPEEVTEAFRRADRAAELWQFDQFPDTQVGVRDLMVWLLECDFDKETMKTHLRKAMNTDEARFSEATPEQRREFVRLLREDFSRDAG